INPALVDFKTTGIKQVEQIYSGCCEKTKSGGTCSTLITQTECESEWRQGTYNCNNLGKCVFSIGVCCLTGGVCSYVNLAPNCSGTKLYGQNCCSQCTISWYKNNVDSSINACSEITATGDGSF
ncbi:hypothetical protein KKA83_00295, partial [Patescibacteria group bacterium]|nr:hypothetical protein [Patescibacteria group bacterium]